VCFFIGVEVVIVLPKIKRGPKGHDANELAAAKQEVARLIGTGETVKNAMAAVDRTPKAYEVWRAKDPEFRAAIERVRRGVTEEVKAKREGDFPSFADFSKEYLDAEVFPHMQNVVDLMEGKDPSWIHPSMNWERNEPDLALVNVPPEHGKSTTLTMNYLTYRIVQDPNIRIIVISKTQTMANKFLFGIKTRLTHPKYAKMQMTYGPVGGFEKNSESWSQNMIYVNSDTRDSGEKDPTVQALGVRGHVYGSRADIIVCDDIVDGTNAHEYEKQIEWIQSEVISCISASGMFLVVGTRLATADLYMELRRPNRYPEEKSPWSFLSMPAVLEYTEDPKDWVTLWPKSNMPEIGAKGELAEPDADGRFIKWDGKRLHKKRSRMQPRTWAMVYQQEQVNTEAIFTPQMLSAAVNGARFAGPIPRNVEAVRGGKGGDGLVYVMGVDPATSGHTAAVVMGLDISTQKRYVVDVFNKPGITPEQMREMICGYMDSYGLAEIRIEKNGFQGFLVHDKTLNNYAASRGVLIQPHYTGSNKHDADFGVASMTALFHGWEDKQCMVEFPSSMNSEAIKSMMEQFATWQPAAPKSQKTDIVMAFWFAELACRDRVITFTGGAHRKNEFLTPWDIRQQRTVSLMDAEAHGLWRPVGAV
jgi:hypothetical protein